MATKTDTLEEQPEEYIEPGNSLSPKPRRVRVALALAVVAFVAAIVGAVGPAKRVHATYSWPPPRLPSGKPASLWYTPLLLERWTPQRLTAHLPCSDQPALANTSGPVTVLATARHPEQADALQVTRRGGQIAVAIGTRTLARLPLARPGEATTSCVYRLHIQDSRFSIAGGPHDTTLTGSLDSMPVVTGLFSELDLRAKPPLSVEIRTQAFTTKPILRQRVAWVLAALAIALSLALLAFERRPRPWLTSKRLARDGVRNAGAVDAVVVTLLLGWWVIAPTFYDDGWVWLRGALYSTIGGFSSYYLGLGATLPSDYWLEWLQHWLAQSTSALILLRIPALVCLVAAWVLCRWVLARVLATSVGASSVAVWTLAGAFLVGAFSWGMTLRPEFATSLLSVAVLACVVRFTERATTGPVVLGAVFVPLAVTGHHAGLVSIAPMLVISPLMLRWSRHKPIAAATIALTSLAWLTLLAFVGSDLQQRRLEAHEATSFATGGTGWLDEIQRYAVLSNPYGTPMRDASVALMLLAVVAFLLRRGRERRPLLDLPASALAVGLLLLVPLPDKWPWHFGALLAVGAVAIASETARLRDDAARARQWQVRPFLVIGAALVATAWIWAGLQQWTVLDLRTLDWVRAFHRLQIGALVAVAPLALMVGASFLGIARRDPRPWRVPWRVAPWTAAIIAFPIIAFTAGVLVADALETHSWTLARQNLEALQGTAGCGVADDYLVALPESAHQLPHLTESRFEPTPAWVPPFPSGGMPRFALGPSLAESASSPWFRVPAMRSIGIFVSGTLASSDSLHIDWGLPRHDGVDELAAKELEIPGALAASVATRLASLGTDRWHLLAAPDLPGRPTRANAVRVTLQSGAPPGAALAVTAPVTYSSKSLASLIGRDAAPTLVMPHLVTYLPCANEPRLKQGIAEVPAYIVSDPALRDVITTPVRYPFSPFQGLLDLYSVSYLPVANLTNPIRDFVVFRVDRHIPGAIVAPPTVMTSSS